MEMNSLASRCRCWDAIVFTPRCGRRPSVFVEGMAWGEIVSGLHGMSGQLRLVAVPGPNASIILDDTYNSSPESAVAALNLLEDLEGRRIAVLGDMLELGPVEERAHRLVGRRVKEVADILVTVGLRGQLMAKRRWPSACRPAMYILWPMPTRLCWR